MTQDKTFIEQQGTLLKKEKETVENALKGFATKDQKLKGDWDTKFPELNSTDLEGSSDEVEEYGNLLPVEFSLEKRLRDINLALSKIVKGNYGQCGKCRQGIPKERLIVYPAAQTCNKCKQ